MRWLVAIGVLGIGAFILDRLDVPLWLSLILEVVAIATAFTAMAAYVAFVGSKQTPK